jgi:CheY-like chemotaxis protein
MMNEYEVVGSCGIAEPAANTDASAEARAPAKWRILVVEDVPSQQKLLERALTSSGHSVATAGSGLQAVDRVEQEPFDVVLMDVQMPGMSGLDAIRVIRERESYQGTHTAIVAVTSHLVGNDSDQCYAAGADAYLPKPIDLTSLMAVINVVATAHPRQARD